MHINLLGPVEVVTDHGQVELGAPKPRALLAMLALEAGSTVSAEHLIDGLWGDAPPATANKLVQLYVSQLRKAMAPFGENGLIATHGAGYELRVGRDHVDAARFERLLAQGAAREALGLWRGPALADVAKEPFAALEVRRLEELRTAALEVALDQDLEAGRHREVLPELDALLAKEPLRERLHGQRMLALYRSGRQAEALEAYRQTRATLVEQIGVEPGPDLRRLHEAILRQDPSLDLPGQAPPGAPLVGRDAELAHLRALWRRARAGSGTSVVVTGPPGIGKTRLVQELAEEVRRDGGAVAYGELEEVHEPTLLVLEDVARAPEVAPDRPVLAVATAVQGEGETMPLAPLARTDVAALARYHAGARAAVEPPVDRLLAESGGVPARLHRAAAAWAGSVATQRVGEAAERASAERAGWHLAGDEVATEVVELQTVRERAQLAGSGGLPACPYKGLASFDVDDASVFFGRERLVADMIARLPGTRLMGVVGPSGSGKSSALGAGLLAALADGVLPGSERWPQALIRPGAHPLVALEDATAGLPVRERWIVAVDQFEEAFTACRDNAERSAFVDALVACARDARRRTLVIIAVRADFYGHCARYPELSRMLGANQILVGPMGRHELRRAIELPARRADVRVEPELVDGLLADAEGEPGALPLLSTALLELWQQRDDHRLTLSAYEGTGGVRGAVARLAESAYERLDTERRRVARSILLRLAGEGEGEGVVRRRVPLAELDAERDDRVADILAVLARERLVTIGEGEVEVAHEALLSEWPRLRGWLEEEADSRRLHRHLIHAAGEWQGSGRDPAELYRGARLASSLDWAASRDSELNDLERQFLAESQSASEREAERQRRTNRRLRALLAGVGVLLAAAVVAGVIALSERQSARDAATVADAERLGAEALNEGRLDQALRLASAGVALDDSVATRSNLHSTLLRSPAAIGVLSGDGDPIRSSALSPDGGTLAVGDDDGTVTLFDTEAREPIGEHQAPGVVWSLAFDPRTDSLAIAGSASPDLLSGYVEILDADTARVRRSISLDRHPAGAGLGFFETANYGPDGRSLIVTYSGGDLDRTTGTFMRRFDAREATPQGRAVRVAPRSTSAAPMSSPDGRLVFSSDRETYAVDPATLRVARRYPVGALTAEISADGGTLAVEDVDGSLRLLDLASGRVRTLAGGAAGVRRSRDIGEDASFGIGAFSPDGRMLATWDDSENVILWDVGGGLPTETFRGHTRDAGIQVFSPDGRTLYTAGDDSKVIIWDVAGDRRLGRPFQTEFVYEKGELFPPPFAISPDGRTVAVARLDGRVDLIDAETLRRTGSFEAFADRSAVAIEYGPGGRALAVAGGGGGVGVWDAASGRRVGPLLRTPRGPVENNPHNVQGMAFARGGLLAAAEVGGTVRTWDLGRRELAGPTLRLAPFALGLAFSPDGSRLAIPFGAVSAEGGDGVEVRDVRSGTRLARLPVDGEVRTVAFSPDGRLLAGGQVDGAALLWATDGWQRVGAPLALREAAALAVEFSPDGRTLATSHTDGALVLWDVGSRQPIGSPLALPGSPREVYTTARFTPDGGRLFAVHEDGRAFRWEVDPDAWRRHACVVAGGLSPEQWSEVVPEQGYVSACPSD